MPIIFSRRQQHETHVTAVIRGAVDYIDQAHRAEIIKAKVQVFAALFRRPGSAKSEEAPPPPFAA